MKHVIDAATQDKLYMLRALALAPRGRGRVEPNPMVGCVLLKDGCIIGEGWHRRFGGPHAEIEALRACRTSPRGATAYVTLEPCCIQGKTPPCTAALIAAGLARVVAATRDPNPRVSGNGLAALRRAGIQVTCGVCEADARRLIAPFKKWIRTQTPWVILKWAQSLDGRIATRGGDSRWISDERMRGDAHQLRGRVDAILVGVGTVLKDDPELTCRLARPLRVASRVVLDSRLRTSLSARLVRTARRVPTIVVCGRRANKSRQISLETAGCRVIRVASDGRGVRLPDTLVALGRLGISSVQVEGGGQVLGSFVDANLGDEFHVYLSPTIIGGQLATPAVGGLGVARVGDARNIRDAKLKRLGRGWLLVGVARE
ncbi:MAG: bifunctional diaminohydroxyphosphoribosylaminopyrimidine deaminase/5-amino-6-(5-phosphoribosylamino)uracil reductase RibD [Phycisphaerae bacterium]